MKNSLWKLYRLIGLGVWYSFGTERLLTPPFIYHIEPTDRCNYSCSFCYHGYPSLSSQRPSGFLTIENFSKIVEEMDSLKPMRRYLALSLGGEPLLHKDFPDMVRIANEKGFRPLFASNGRLLLPEVTDRLVRAGQWHAMIDFSSIPEVFDKHRGGRGDFEIVLKNLRYLVSVVKEYPHTHSVSLMDMSHYGGKYRDGTLDDIRSLFPSELPRNIAFGKVDFHNACGLLGANFEKKMYRICPYPWVQMAIAWNGDVVACCRDIEGKTILGNVLKNSIMEIWRSKTYVLFRKNLRNRKPEKNAACARCDMPWSSGSRRWKLSYILSLLLGDTFRKKK